MRKNSKILSRVGPVSKANGVKRAKFLSFFDIQKIKKEILGKRYELSFCFVSKNKIKELNKKYRKIDKATDILSFPIEKNLGEIFISKEMAAKKSKDFNLTPRDYLLFLVIHGCLHLKGLDHGPKMESLEHKFSKKFKIPA